MGVAAGQNKLWRISNLLLLDGIIICSFSILVYVGAAPVISPIFEDNVDLESAAEILRPRCGRWVKSEQPFAITNTKQVFYAPYAVIEAIPPYLNGSGWIKVSWSGLPRHVDPLAFWIGIYLEDENVTRTAPIKYISF